MKTLMASSSDDYEKQMAAVKKRLSEAVKGSDSEILKETAKEVKREDDPKIVENCRLVRMLVDEALDEYEEGDMEFKDMIEDLYKALKAI